MFDQTTGVTDQAAAAARPGRRAPEHRQVPLSLLEVDPAQPRKDARSDIGDLAASLSNHGLLQAVVVAGWPDASRAGYYRVVAGERRVRAARSLGWTEIDTLILGPGAHRFLLAVTENIQRRDLSREERRHAFLRILEECGGDKTAAASLLGVSQTTFYRTIAEPDGQAYATWSPRGSLKRLEKAATRMPPDRRRQLASELRGLAARLEDSPARQ